MPNLVNIDAEVGANMIGDDSQPTLTFDNSSTGADIRTGIIESSGEGQLFRRAEVGNISTGIVRVQGTSLASGAVLEFTGKGAFVSITSTVLTTVANTDYAIRVQVGLETRYIPLFKDAAIIGAAAFT